MSPQPTPRLFNQISSLLTTRESHSSLRRLSLTPPNSADFSSNDFLSLATSQPLRTSYLSELTSPQALTLPLGSGGSRLLDGNSPYAETLETSIAAFHNAPAALLFNSGFDANSGVFACLPQKGDVLLYDEYIHASVHEGMRLSRAGIKRSFAHNCVGDFERVLDEIVAADAGVRAGERNVFVAVETVYSMDGDVAPLVALLDLLDARLPLGNGHMIVDEAHATGVFGEQGRGLVCALGVEERVLVRLHTFGKALSSGGAVVLCSPLVRDYLVNYARSLIYTTAMGLPTLAMIKTVYTFLSSGRTVAAQQRLWYLISYLHTALLQLPETAYLALPKELPKSPISFLWSPQPRSLAKWCQERGFVVRPIVPPTVPEGGQRVRVCLHAGNTEGEIDGLVAAVRGWILKLEEGEGKGRLIDAATDMGAFCRPRL